jgi:hypothetical protein
MVATRRSRKDASEDALRQVDMQDANGSSSDDEAPEEVSLAASRSVRL